MSCPELKRQFANDCILNGWAGAPEGYSSDHPKGPAKWFRRLHKEWRPVLRPQPRLVNHFKVGADPEFVFLDQYGDGRLDANYFHFRTGLAFGADQNGRLVEVRPKPSRFALEVLTSALAAMRWMACCYPRTREYQWRAGAYVLRDGLGGHVHLGRKSAKRTLEICALDRLNEILLRLGCYPAHECYLRQRGDNFGQRYGLPGDIRPQTYGYEYRTFPSWLDSPWMAYLTLVLAKLSVHDPILRDVACKSASVPAMRQTVRNFLAKWQGLDDDARIALVTLVRLGFPRWTGGDFKARWGLVYSKETERPEIPAIFPSSIPPRPEEVCELFHHLVGGSALAPVVPQPSWNATLPKGYVPVLSYTETYHQGGLGEIVADAVVHESKMVCVTGCDGEVPVRISGDLLDKAPTGWEHAFEHLHWRKDAPIRQGMIRFNATMRAVDKQALAKRILFSGFFPIWKASEVKEDSFKEFLLQALKETKGPVKSKVIAEE